MKQQGKFYIFFTTSIFKSIKPKFGYENKAGWEKVKKEEIQLPVKDGKIDYEYMQNLIAAIQKREIQKIIRYFEEKPKQPNENKNGK